MVGEKAVSVASVAPDSASLIRGDSLRSRPGSRAEYSPAFMKMRCGNSGTMFGRPTDHEAGFKES